MVVRVKMTNVVLEEIPTGSFPSSNENLAYPIAFDLSLVNGIGVVFEGVNGCCEMRRPSCWKWSVDDYLAFY
jgi:hypothetical protein